MSATAGEAKADVGQYVAELGKQARAAGRVLAASDCATRNSALLAGAEAIEAEPKALRQANERDLEAGRQQGLDSAMLDRLTLTPERLQAMAAGLRQVAGLADPVGAVDGLTQRPSGIQVGRMRVPLGVVGIIYESRPNVTADAAALCLKSGNAAILRGGSEAFHSNQAIAACLARGIASADLPAEAVQVVATADRAAVGALITQDDTIDVLVPRGGKGLIERLSREASIPVIKHLDGVCHVYIDAHAEPDKAERVAINAKTQRYGVCNSMETLLIHADIAPEILPALAQRLIVAGVALRGCECSRALVPGIEAATLADWGTEYLGPVLAIRVVADLAAAIEHIETYGSRHTDAIVTEHWGHAQRFLREVDSSSVMVNASTRFADGFEYGLGAEIGVSTDKLHARGPVGLEGLTTTKYIVLGDGHVRT